MRGVVLLGLAMLVSSAWSDDLPIAAKSWFTEAVIPESIQLPQPTDACSAAPGSAGDGVELNHAIPIEDPLLCQADGYIGFWLQPDWDGNDGAMHKILLVGDPNRNGLSIEKTPTGMLRFVMASPTKITVSRADVSHWKTGQWHHVVVAWFSNQEKPIGLPLWIDRVAVAGSIAGGNSFLNPEELDDPRVWIGDTSSDAVMDELIFRNNLNAEGPEGLRAIVYRDYFRTAPYTEIEITHQALRVASDRRVVVGHEKQFGLLGKLAGNFEYLTDYAVRYSQWGDFDAKPLIKWRTSDDSIATVDENGMVTGNTVGNCTLFAEFRGMTATYDLEVISVEQPDLALQYVERLPRYLVQCLKNVPSPGERVESVVHLENFGFAPAPAGVVVRFELIADANRNYELDQDEQPAAVQELTLDAPLAPRAQQIVSFQWEWPVDPVWVRITLDPQNRVPELCEANNHRCELNIARPMRWGYEPKSVENWYAERRINHVGSFSHYDWINAHCDRFNLVLRDAVMPTTTPHGIEDRLRSDNFIAILGESGGDAPPWHEQPWEKVKEWYDGGFPIREKVDAMAIDAAILHEFGHTCVALPDLYGYPVRAENVFLEDENGNRYGGSAVLPEIRDDVLMLSSAMGVPCGSGYSPLMDGCHLWLHPAHAGQVQYLKGYRGDRFWGIQGRFVPTREHILQIYDINDQPLSGAAVYVYQAAQTKSLDASDKYFVNRPKFIGHTDSEGAFQFPMHTDEDWDDPETDRVEGRYPVWNPFGCAVRDDHPFFDVAFTPNVWRVEGLLLLKIVSDEQVEFTWLCLTDLNEAFFRGERVRGIYPIRTSLSPSENETRLVRPQIPEEIRETNLQPVAVTAEEVTVKVGLPFRLDGSKSHDPEGRPLSYRWKRIGHGIQPQYGFEPVLEGIAPDRPGTFEYRFYVIDGLRCSEFIKVIVNVVE